MMSIIFTWTGFAVLMAILFLLFLFIALKALELVGRVMRQSKAIWMGAIFYWHGKKHPQQVTKIIIDYIERVNVKDPYVDYKMKEAIKKASEAIREVETEETTK